MKCSVCSVDMQTKDFGGVHADVCPTCKGMWFDWNELKNLDEHNEGLGAALVEALESEQKKNKDRGQINCPKCQKPMIAHNYQSQKYVTVDECYLCGGFFLDAGELKTIRDNFLTESERDAVVINMVSSLGAQTASDTVPQNIPGTEDRREAVHKFMTRLFTK